MADRKPYDVKFRGEDEPRRLLLADHQVKHFERAAVHEFARVESIEPAEGGDDS